MRHDHRDALDAMILMAAGIDRRDRSAVGMPEQQPAAKADRIEQLRQHIERLGVHVIDGTRQFHRRRGAVARAGIKENSGAGGGL